jgi:hypothetical protein
MSGIKKTDRFTPVVTVVIYYGSEPWDGPTCLYDMLDLPEELKPFINNFKVNLVEARDNNLVFHNQNNKDLFSLLKIIYDDLVDRKERREQIKNYEKARTIDKSVRMVIAATSKVNLNEYEKEEDATVCKLWDEVREDGRAEEIVSMGVDFGLSKEEIVARLQKKLQIELQQAEEYYNMYSEEYATI